MEQELVEGAQGKILLEGGGVAGTDAATIPFLKCAGCCK